MDLVHLLVYLVIFCVIGYLVWYLVSLMPLPQPFKNAILIILCLIGILILLSFVGIIPGGWRAASLLTHGRVIT